ncbi:DUF72 domain-containing protein [Pseudalkalibacillus berkeleyi]|uniref:DUF72 domain-containing protein n=1 Tax=Pseudalkalibacillus berkeleyi TaxID=1069813 RepID=A0ABS9H3M2_9BACL|nr:DUF72 domain-containing protein [Pseudalkalibacillus berkeleyi]MCF6138555.1 DUF72 domain-containing protein [Pseudalkalibacillus berkeleyi]
MIEIGVTGWGDHDSLYAPDIRPTDKLKTYSSFFPTVEVDSSFYAIQPIKNYQKWVRDTPDRFSFVVKAYQGMTGHTRGEIPFSTADEMFNLFKESIQPLQEANKLKMVLFQYPPWFDCNRDNVEQLRLAKEKMGDIPVALEFRHQSWFHPSYIERTLDFMREEEWIHSICDEPQAGSGSVPRVLEKTHPQQTLIRFHGRNEHGWQKKGNPNWRDVRYLYRYNKEELIEWKERLVELHTPGHDLTVLFNNNSGGDAADNAKEVIDLLGIEYGGLAPRQLDLF